MSSRRTRPALLVLALASIGIAIAVGWPAAREARVQAAPVQVEISRAEFASIIDSLSEPEGYFDTDNFISNETSYLHVVDRLTENVAPGRVYVGVGPDQNFTYIVHSQPSIAIVADIRRQNMLQHLFFKVLIEEAEDRYDFLCRLFARVCTEAGAADDLQRLLDQVRTSPPDQDRLDKDVAAVRGVLTGEYGFELSETDFERLEYVHRSFAGAGLSLRFTSFGRSGVGYPTFAELMLETDLDGDYASFLSSEELFGRLQEFQRENRLIPIVGDFAGAGALRATAAFLERRGLEVSVFYASNVEFYLFGGPAWAAYVNNVRAFPFSADAVFIRAYFPTFGTPHRQNVSGHRSTTLIQSVAGFLSDAASGRMRTYWDVVSRNLQ